MRRIWRWLFSSDVPTVNSRAQGWLRSELSKPCSEPWYVFDTPPEQEKNPSEGLLESWPTRVPIRPFDEPATPAANVRYPQDRTRPQEQPGSSSQQP